MQNCRGQLLGSPSLRGWSARKFAPPAPFRFACLRFARPRSSGSRGGGGLPRARRGVLMLGLVEDLVLMLSVFRFPLMFLLEMPWVGHDRGPVTGVSSDKSVSKREETEPGMRRRLSAYS